MKKLGLVLLLPACLQQGLVADPNALTNETTTTNTGGTDPDLEPAIALTKKSNQTFKTIFGDKGYVNTRPIQGYGSGQKGETFCFSNESNTESPCKKPLESDNLSEREDTLLESLFSNTDRSSASGLGMILHTIQLYFSSTKTAPDNNYYSKVSALKISIKTAPLTFSESAGTFEWDSANEIIMTYAGSSSCNLSEPNSVGFDIGADSSLGTKSERKKYFVTGLWIFERSPTKPYESINNNVSPIGPYAGTSDGPSQLFATRANIFTSLLIPSYVKATEKYDFQYFPGENSGNPDAPDADAPSSEPAPAKFTIGLYNQDSIHAGADLASEDSRSTLFTDDGAIVTPVMGKYDQNGDLLSSSNATSKGIEWQKRVITGLCISGIRTTYNGSATSTSSNPIWNYPVIHALRYELRKIKVVLK